MGNRRKHLEVIPGGASEPQGHLPDKPLRTREEYENVLSQIRYRSQGRRGLHATPPDMPASPRAGMPSPEQAKSREYGRIAMAWYRRVILGQPDELPEGVTSLVDFEATKMEKTERGLWVPGDDPEPPEPTEPPAA